MLVIILQYILLCPQTIKPERDASCVHRHGREKHEFLQAVLCPVSRRSISEGLYGVAVVYRKSILRGVTVDIS